MPLKVQLKRILLLMLLAAASGIIFTKRESLTAYALQLIEGPSKASAVAAKGGFSPSSAPAANEDETETTSGPVALPPKALPPADAALLIPFDPDTVVLSEELRLPDRVAPVVYVAPFTDGKSDDPTSASESFGHLLMYQLRAASLDFLPLNVVPAVHLEAAHKNSDGSKSKFTGKPLEVYREDAARMGADIFISGIVTGVEISPDVAVSITDLKTSRTETWSSTTSATADVGGRLAGAARACGLFAGLKESEISAAELDKDFFGPRAWNLWLKGGLTTESEVMAALQAEPDNHLLYEYGQKSNSLGLLDQGLKRFPDESRLYRGKARVLMSQKKRYEALLVCSEWLRRQPDSFYAIHTTCQALRTFYMQGDDAVEIPPAYQIALNHLRSLCDRYPRNWPLLWDYASASNKLAEYIRGTRTVDKIPDSTFRQRDKLTADAVKAAEAAIAIQPDCPQLLTDYMDFSFDNGNTDPDWQDDLIKRIHKLDPDNLTAEMRAAYSHSVGWGSPRNYFYFMDNARKNHAGDWDAMRQLATMLASEVRRQVAFKVMTKEEAYYKPNPYADRFIETAEAALKSGKSYSFEKFLGEIYLGRFGEAKLAELTDSGRSGYWSGEAAKTAHEKSDWENCLRHAKAAKPKFSVPANIQRQQYYIVKSLWKLKRHEESMAESRKGFEEFPEDQTFHYMFAIVADEHGKPLEEAYEHAVRAVDISTTNTGCNETFERLRAKLNKPQHSKLP